MKSAMVFGGSGSFERNHPPLPPLAQPAAVNAKAPHNNNVPRRFERFGKRQRHIMGRSLGSGQIEWTAECLKKNHARPARFLAPAAAIN